MIWSKTVTASAVGQCSRIYLLVEETPGGRTLASHWPGPQVRGGAVVGVGYELREAYFETLWIHVIG